MTAIPATPAPRDIIAEFLWRDLFGHTREVWAKLPPEKRRPFEAKADVLMAKLGDAKRAK